MARNWDDFLQRDLKALTFPRAFGIWILNSMALSTGIILYHINNSMDMDKKIITSRKVSY